MFSLLRQNMELTTFHGLLHERDLVVVHLHSRISQPSSHGNTSAAGANNSLIIQRHVPDIASEHGTNYISWSPTWKGSGCCTLTFPHQPTIEPRQHLRCRRHQQQCSHTAPVTHVPVIAAEHGTNSSTWKGSCCSLTFPHRPTVEPPQHQRCRRQQQCSHIRLPAPHLK